jgi:hypothetical protein
MRQSEIFQSKSFYPNKESHFVVDQRQLAKKRLSITGVMIWAYHIFVDNNILAFE